MPVPMPPNPAIPAPSTAAASPAPHPEPGPRDPKPAPPSLLSDYLSRCYPPIELAARHNITVHQLFDWSESPEVASTLDRLERFEARRERHLAAAARLAALGALLRAAEDLPDPAAAPPATIARIRATNRAAAAALIKFADSIGSQAGVPWSSSRGDEGHEPETPGVGQSKRNMVSPRDGRRDDVARSAPPHASPLIPRSPDPLIPLPPTSRARARGSLDARSLMARAGAAPLAA